MMMSTDPNGFIMSIASLAVDGEQQANESSFVLFLEHNQLISLVERRSAEERLVMGERNKKVCQLELCAKHSLYLFSRVAGSS